jgi:aspartate/methionine/tyrosine aminotransferase
LLLKLTTYSTSHCPTQAILQSMDDAWMQRVMATLEESADVVVAGLAGVRGLQVTSRPQGALYVMVKVNLDLLEGVADDLAFATALLAQVLLLTTLTLAPCRPV